MVQTENRSGSCRKGKQGLLRGTPAGEHAVRKYADEFEDDVEDEEYEAAVEEMKQDRTEFSTEMALRMAAEHGGKSMTTLLEDPEVFVIDTGATCHSTGNCIGMTDMKDAKGSKTRTGNVA